MAEVEVDEVFGFVGHKGSEVAANDAVPCRSLSLIELRRLVYLLVCGVVWTYGLLDVLGNVLLLG